MAAYDIVVVGAGPAGMMAAGQAAELGTKVLLLEKMVHPGRKLFISGKGRCNLTNVAPVNEFLTHFGENGLFLRNAFHRFFSSDLIQFFDELNVPTVTERGGRVFPISNQAQDVVNALVWWNRKIGVELRRQASVTQLILAEKRITAVEVSGKNIPARAVIIATGGASYPGTGSTGDGYKMAEAVGHTLIPVRPALVPLTTAGDFGRRLQGLSLRNIEASVWIDGEKQASEFGEMLFTHFGLSGPIILTLSRVAVDGLNHQQKVAVSIDLKPALDEGKLDARLLRDLDQSGKRQFQTMLKDLLPQRLIPICADLTSIPVVKEYNQITAEERQRLIRFLKDFRLKVTGHRGFKQAIVTAGGVATGEIDPRTMASRLIEGLYFAGEILDVDADTGGYNLQAAFSTGWVAGRAAAEKCLCKNKHER